MPLALLVVVLCCSTQAEAAYPGKSGKLAVGKRDRLGNETLFTVDPRTRRVRPLTMLPAECRGRRKAWTDDTPSYSASGRSLVFVHWDRCDPRSSNGVYRMRADGSGRSLLIRRRRRFDPQEPVLSPDSSTLAFTRYWTDPGDPDAGDEPTLLYAIYLASLNRTGKVGRPRRRFGYPSDSPAWSDSGLLAFSSDQVDSVIWTTSADLRSSRAVTHGGADGCPDWSPDSRLIIFARSYGEKRGADVYAAGESGERLRRLTRTRDATCPVWSPAGDRIAFVRERKWASPVGSLQIVRSDGRRSRRIARGISTAGLSWQPLPRRR